MAEWKQASRHLRAAQKWLHQAERSFDEKKEIRGELNMMLARAELRHAEETERSRGYHLKRHGIAFVIAGLVIGFCSILFMSRSAEPQVQPVMQAVSGSTDKTTFGSAVPEDGERRVIEVRQTNAAAPAVSPHAERAESAAQQYAVPVSISKKEMTDLTRAAARSLHGQ